ncbi:MAG: glycosyltransferase [Alphaproteobacteria bacterium]
MATSSIPHLLILEPDSRGHAREWVGHLVAAANRAGPDALRLSLVVPPALAEEVENASPPGPRQTVRAITLTPGEVASCMHRRLWISGMARWWIMRRYMVRAEATHGLFLALDHLSLPLALGLGAGHRPLSGILFRPSVHYRHINAHQPSWRERLRDLRKAILYRLMLRNPAVGTVLSLDPYFADFAAAHRYPQASKVVATPDPVCPAPAPTAAERRLADRVPEERTTFVLFGELTARKGVLVLLDALKLIPPEVARRIAIVVAGSLDPPIRDTVRRTVAHIHRLRPDLWLNLEDRRLATGEIVALLERSQVVLVPYQRFVGSSGIVLWAAQAKRPVLCQDYGLVGRLTRDFGLGTTLDTTSAESLAQAMAAAARDSGAITFDTRGMDRLCGSRRPERFAQIVIEGALCGHHDTRLAPAPSGREAVP